MSAIVKAARRLARALDYLETLPVESALQQRRIDGIRIQLGKEIHNLLEIRIEQLEHRMAHREKPPTGSEGASKIEGLLRSHIEAQRRLLADQAQILAQHASILQTVRTVGDTVVAVVKDVTSTIDKAVKAGTWPSASAGVVETLFPQAKKAPK